jgi:hypothetical protein
VIRIAAYEFPFVFLKPMFAVLTVGMIVGGILLKGIHEEPTLGEATVRPYFKLERTPTGVSFPVTTALPIASGTAVASSNVRLVPYSGGSVDPTLHSDWKRLDRG